MTTKQKTKVAVDFTSMTAVEAIAKAINTERSLEAQIEEEIAPALEQLSLIKERVKELNDKLSKAMIAHNRHNLFIEGFQFTLKHNPPNFEIANEELALEWAQQNNCMRIDTTKAKTLLKREILTPGGFLRNDSITVARSAEKSVEEK